MRLLNNRPFVLCLAALCITFAVSSVSVFGGESCGTKAAKASGSSCCPTMRVAKTDGSCAVEAAAREYLAKVAEIGSANGSQCCPGTNAMKGLMAVLSENEAYRPMVAQFEELMTRQSGAQTVAMVKSSDCSSPCGSAKNAGLASGNSDCSQSCGSAKNAGLASGNSDCSQPCGPARNAALAGDKSDCSQPCGSAKNAALASAKTGDCCGSCGGAAPANYVAFNCTKCNALARTAAEAYLSLMMEIKKVADAEGCPLEAADLTLAAVMRDMQNASQANAGDAAGNATTVSLSTVSEKKSDCCSTPCEAVTKK